jgi:16S rRNA (adenine1518-N6/adenine1519-N6)-dimethyltransferase
MDHSKKKITPLKTRTILRKYNLHPKKSLGQNFLQDDIHLQKIIDTAQIQSSEIVLEIGPGLGSLTRLLAASAEKVIAVELDKNLIPPLNEVLNNYNNVKIVQADILDLDISQHISTSDYVVVANIPYYITSALIRHLLESSSKPNRIILTVQMEVALRLCAAPPNMNLLALSVQVYGRPRITTRIPAGAFYPPPSVDSAVIRIDLFPESVIPGNYLDVFFKITKSSFNQRRKTLRNSLSNGLSLSKSEIEQILESVKIDPNRRPQTLVLEEWKTLSQKFRDFLSSQNIKFG